MMDPQQELYTALLTRLIQAYPGQIYDGDMPPEGTPYPFIYLGDTQQLADLQVKGAIFGRVAVDIHLWHDNPRKRGDLSLLLFRVKQLARSIGYTDSYGWCLAASDDSIRPDTSTGQVLMHAVLSLEFKHFWR